MCGVEVDQQLVSFAADVDWAKQNGAQIERFNLAQQPIAFADNAVVKGLLERSGESALPVTMVDGEVALAGRYPAGRSVALVGRAVPASEPRLQRSSQLPVNAARAGRWCWNTAQTHKS